MTEATTIRQHSSHELHTLVLSVFVVVSAVLTVLLHRGTPPQILSVVVFLAALLLLGVHSNDK